MSCRAIEAMAASSGGRGPPSRQPSNSDLAVSPSLGSASRMHLHVGVLQVRATTAHVVPSSHPVCPENS